jgi:hypothetical protein
VPEAGSLQVPIKKPSPKCIVVPIVLKMEDVDHQVFFPQDALVISSWSWILNFSVLTPGKVALALRSVMQLVLPHRGNRLY